MRHYLASCVTVALAVAMLALSPAPALAQGILFGPPQGNGCQPGPGDSVFGNPGNGQQIPNGVTSTSTSANYQDTNNDGQISVFCQAEIDFSTGLAAELLASLKYDGSWNAPGFIDVNGQFEVIVDPGPAVIITDINDFQNSQGGIFQGGGEIKFETKSTNNTLRVSGTINMAGPPGFGADMNIPASIDGTVVRAPSVPTLSTGAMLFLLMLVVLTGWFILHRRTAAAG